VAIRDIHAGERRRIMLGFEVSGMARLGATTVCELEFRWIDVTSTTGKVARMPIDVYAVAAAVGSS
jgi:hypothetical protein